MLLRYRPDESVLDEIIGPEHIMGQCAGIASQARDFFFEKPPEIAHLSRLCSWQSTQPGVAPESERHRRNLDDSEAQSSQDLLLCRPLRLIGDELHTGFAGSSQISV
jgi:hypothetical protein